MKTITAHTNNKDIVQACNEIKTKLDSEEIEVIIYFASSSYEPSKIAKFMQDSFPNKKVFGCSSAGEIISGKIDNSSIVAMGFTKDVISSLSITVLENISKEIDLSKFKENVKKDLGISAEDLDYKKYLGLILVDGISVAEEHLMDKLGNVTNIIFSGASAGDDLKFQETYIYYDGKVYNNAALLVVIEPTRGYYVIKTESYNLTGKKLVANKVNEKDRIIEEFNGKPALTEYLSQVGQEFLPESAFVYFANNPLGLRVGHDIYIRAPRAVADNNTLLLQCNLLEGMEVELLECSSADIVADTKKALDKAKKELGEINALLSFNCAYRIILLSLKNQVQDYADLFLDFPTAGFCAYGEQYLGHLNQTGTIIALK